MAHTISRVADIGQGREPASDSTFETVVFAGEIVSLGGRSTIGGVKGGVSLGSRFGVFGTGAGIDCFTISR